MPIEKLPAIFRDEATVILKNKINELIDFINTREQDRSEQMARMIDRVNKLETQMGRCIDYLNEQENRLKDIENAPQPKEEEMLGCPWCNEIPFIDCGHSILLSYPLKISWMIRCKNTKCVINPMLRQPFYSKQEAIAAWNSRK